MISRTTLLLKDQICYWNSISMTASSPSTLSPVLTRVSVTEVMSAGIFVAGLKWSGNRFCGVLLVSRAKRNLCYSQSFWPWRHTVCSVLNGILSSQGGPWWNWIWHPWYIKSSRRYDMWSTAILNSSRVSELLQNVKGNEGSFWPEVKPSTRHILHLQPTGKLSACFSKTNNKKTQKTQKLFGLGAKVLISSLTKYLLRRDLAAGHVWHKLHRVSKWSVLAGPVKN